MEESITTIMFAFGAAAIFFVMYGLPIIGIAVGSLIAKKVSSKKRLGILLVALSGIWLLAAVVGILYNGFK